jgi:menaquinone-dependent protoporphyrinogen IX oxidase
MRIPKVLVVYCARTRRTEDVAHAIQNCLEIRGLRCDLEPLRETTAHMGALGSLGSGLEAALGKHAAILPLNHNPEDYDVVVVGTPLGSGSISTTVRLFLEANAERLKSVAVFLTHGDSTSGSAFTQMQELAARPTVAQLEVRENEVAGGEYKRALRPFSDRVAREARLSTAVGGATLAST